MSHQDLGGKHCCRESEWIGGIMAAGWGAVLLMEGSTFGISTWEVVATLYNENALGVVFLVLGVARLAALGLETRHEPSSSIVRTLTALVSTGMMIFMAVAVYYATRDGITINVWTFFVTAMVDLRSAVRAGVDVGRSGVLDFGWRRTLGR